MTNIVMLVRNRLRLTKQAIDSLYKHTDPTQFNLTVIDDESDDFRLIRLLYKIIDNNHGPATNATMVVAQHTAHVLSQLKNLGVYWSEQRWGRGDWLCLCDNDIYFKPGWLEQMIAAATHSFNDKYELLGGQSHPYHLPHESILRFPLPFKHGVDRDGSMTYGLLTEHDCLAGTHWFMPWSTWDLYGPLDRTTAPGVCQSEDYAFTQRIRASGGRIGVVQPHVVIDTSLTQTDGQPCPGAAEKRARMVEGVIYE